MPNPINVAVLGFWHVHAAEYAARAQRHPDTALVAAWDDDPLGDERALTRSGRASLRISTSCSPATTSTRSP